MVPCPPLRSTLSLKIGNVVSVRQAFAVTIGYRFSCHLANWPHYSVSIVGHGQVDVPFLGVRLALASKPTVWAQKGYLLHSSCTTSSDIGSMENLHLAISVSRLMWARLGCHWEVWEFVNLASSLRFWIQLSLFWVVKKQSPVGMKPRDFATCHSWSTDHAQCGRSLVYVVLSHCRLCPHSCRDLTRTCSGLFWWDLWHLFSLAFWVWVQLRFQQAGGYILL